MRTIKHTSLLNFKTRGFMPSITRFFAAIALTLITSVAFPQGFPAQSVRPKLASGSADQTNVPKLEHFDPDVVDKTLDPCNDFYKYSCSKWVSANPIPGDQVYWNTGSGLELWNEGVLRETLEASSKNDPNRTAVQQKIGDYWSACMDEAGIEAAGLKSLEPELARISALKSKQDITLEVAHLQHALPGAWQAGDNESSSPLFGFTGTQDYDDASMVVAQIDQAGLSLPNRDYYLNPDDKSKEILTKYRAHLKK